MTRSEVTGFRCLEFSQWIRTNLPDSSTGYSVSDLDFCLWNWKEQKFMMLEIKTRNATIKPFQKIMWHNLNRWVTQGIDQGWEYYGFHIIMFENTNFEDGNVFLNDRIVTEEELIKFLSFERWRE